MLRSQETLLAFPPPQDTQSCETSCTAFLLLTFDSERRMSLFWGSKALNWNGRGVAVLWFRQQSNVLCQLIQLIGATAHRVTSGFLCFTTFLQNTEQIMSQTQTYPDIIHQKNWSGLSSNFEQWHLQEWHSLLKERTVNRTEKVLRWWGAKRFAAAKSFLSLCAHLPLSISICHTQGTLTNWNCIITANSIPLSVLLWSVSINYVFKAGSRICVF